MHNFEREFKQVPVAVGLSVLLVVIYLAEALRSGSLTIDMATMYNFGGLVPAAVFAQNEWWRLLTAGFIHVSLTHMLLNVVVIYFIGRLLEMSLGSLQLAVLFLVGVIGGNLFAMLLGNVLVISLGASGGAFTLVGAIIYLGLRENRRGVWREQMQTMIIFVGMNVVFSLFDSSIGIWAHVGGFLMGLTLTGGLIQSRYAQNTFKSSKTTTILAYVSTAIILGALVFGVLTRLNGIFY
ncbi:rhomboid family intramembrane serine protease [Weissella ceti]|uniref:Rhomboid family intramembrane serine protease n=1 Tax=Weissella ceti TaxID=759620 RepID=A0ABT3E2B8_9LACO|nr:rhomboid family intramembrane serine protease [Weissella ceti]MCW0952495.1 rhomboid family intramembrane serine protease [Weissella ceti]QVK11835.1 rhomboid family intramembrane serine protease [Weissella ceti]